MVGQLVRGEGLIARIYLHICRLYSLLFSFFPRNGREWRINIHAQTAEKKRKRREGRLLKEGWRAGLRHGMEEGGRGGLPRRGEEEDEGEKVEEDGEWREEEGEGEKLEEVEKDGEWKRRRRRGRETREER